MEYRIEHDTMGELKVPADKYWGAQTQRSFENFKIGSQTMPVQIIRAFAILKKAVALTNYDLGTIDKDRSDLIVHVCDEILDGKHDDNFPLVIYQTGSGTQSNMNLNEVIANRGNEIANEKVLHPNDHVNKSQSSNDTFPTAMHIAAVTEIDDHLIPALIDLRDALLIKEKEFCGIVKTGRTHLQDATPLTLGQEISGWRSMIDHSIEQIIANMDGLYELALGGTAVGTGLNAPKDFDVIVAGKIAELTGKRFITAKNKFHSLTSKDALVSSHGSLKALAANLMKIANDVRWLASGPRCGIGEIFIPENEPGSSIMPGKVNPTQCEAVTMVVARVMGNDVTIGIGASQGNFQLNVFMPVMISSYLESAILLADCMRSFNENCIKGIEPNLDKIQENLDKTLMLVTVLNPYIGYESAAKVAKLALKENISLKDACCDRMKLMEPEAFDEIVDPKKMVGCK